MKITDAKFERKYSVADYESATYSLSATLDDGDDAVETLSELKSAVESAHTGEKVEPKKDKPKKTTTKPKKEEEDDTNDADDSNDDEDTETGSNEAIEEDEDSSEDDEDTETDSDDNDSSDSEESEPPKSAKGKAPAKGKGKKPQAYDREVEAHKEIFSTLLKEISPNWKKTDAGKAKAKKASAKLVRHEFLDADGEVLPSFKKALKTLMK